MAHLLQLEELSVKFQTRQHEIVAVDGISLEVNYGEKLGIVGESGAGKSVTAMTIMGLLSRRKDVKLNGRILLNGDNLLEKRRQDMERLRGSQISMIFQDPVDSLNPVFRVGDQVAEAFMVHRKIDKRAAWNRALEQLQKVGIRSPERTARQYPYQLSGGMCQRVMIALAMAESPSLLIADESTTDLDVTVQAQILRLLDKLHHDTSTSIVIITHDLGVVCQFCQRIAVMLGGKIVETGTTEDIFLRTKHPYTRGLLDSIPVPGRTERLKPMPPERGDPGTRITGCHFAKRCPMNLERCFQQQPCLHEVSPGHRVACLLQER